MRERKLGKKEGKENKEGIKRKKDGRSMLWGTKMEGLLLLGETAFHVILQNLLEKSKTKWLCVLNVIALIALKVLGKCA